MAHDRVLRWNRNLQTETLTTLTSGTPIAIGKRKVIGISTDGAVQAAFGGSGVTAGPTYASYSESNSDSTTSLNSTGKVGIGQSFSGGAMGGNVLTSVKFYLKKTLAPTGNAVAKIYATTGTHGSSAIPTGAALASSDNFNVATLTGALALTTLTFSGANQIELDSNQTYFLSLEYSGGDATNTVDVGYDGSAPTHAGNYADLTGTTWTAQAGRDVVFCVTITASDTRFPAAGVNVLETPFGATHLVLYNPTASSVITSVFETAN